MIILKRKIKEPEDLICIELIQQSINFDPVQQKFTIPSNLNFDGLPKQAVDNFLDFVTELELNDEQLSLLYQKIKEGKLIIECEGF
jgi:hypothetical protein